MFALIYVALGGLSAAFCAAEAERDGLRTWEIGAAAVVALLVWPMVAMIALVAWLGDKK